MMTLSCRPIQPYAALLAILACTAISCSSEKPKEETISPEPAKQSGASGTTSTPSKENASALDGSAKLLELAESGTGMERYTAIDDLGELHSSPAAVPVLTKLLSDKDPLVRWRSARALGDFDSQATSAVPTLVSLLGDSDPIVQYHAAIALGRIGDKSDATVQALVKSVTSNDGRVARAAIGALRVLQPEPRYVVEALQKVLASDDDAVVLYAMEAIVERGAAATPLLNEALKNPATAYMACTAIEQIGPAAKETVPALAELLTKTKHSQVLIHALLALASIGPDAQSASPEVVPLLTMTTDKTVPVAAAYALGSMKAPGVDAELQAATQSDNEFLQMVAAWALAMNSPDDQERTQQAVDHLTQGLKSDDAALRTAAAKCLELLHAPADMVAPALIELANDPDPEVVDHVVSALASRGESVVPKAIAGLQNPKLRGLATKVLARVGPDAKAAVQPLIEAAAGADSPFRRDIHVALASIGPDAAPATDILIESLDSDDEGVRHSALFALRQIGPNALSSQAKLIEMLEAEEEFDQLASAWALASIAAEDQEVVAKIVPVLRKGLADPDAAERLETLSVIGDLGASAAPLRDDVKKLADSDPDAAVRTAAGDALKNVGE